MKTLFTIIAIVIALLIALIFLTAYICFRIAFYAPRGTKAPLEEFDLPKGKIYEPYYEQMIAWTKEVRSMSHEVFSITSFDGLKLSGKYYEYEPNAPIEIMFHGYRGNVERDFSGGVQRCFKLGRSVLLVDQRTSGSSEGNVISFGINESRDCLSWINFVIEHFGSDVKIFLTGLSMGASTVMLASGKELPSNVVGILADCGFTSAKEILKRSIREMGLPANLLYPFVKSGAKIYGHFDLEETTALDAIKKCQVPILFIHGDTDDVVPFEMGIAAYETCPAPKKLFTVHGAGHGMCYLMDRDGYFKILNEFIEMIERQEY